MLRWFSAEESGSSHTALGSSLLDSSSSEMFSEVPERLVEMEGLVKHLKDLIREKEAEISGKDGQIKAERESFESKLSKVRLQNKAKIMALTSQMETFQKSRNSELNLQDHSEESAAASRGKILQLRKKLDDLEHQLTRRDQELQLKVQELVVQQERGSTVDAMLAEKDKLLSEKEAYIVHLQTGLSGEHTVRADESPALQSLTKDVAAAEERCHLLRQQLDGLQEQLESEKAQFKEKENMYKSSIQIFKDIVLEKDTVLLEKKQTHEQELLQVTARLASTVDLQQKLQEKEEVLLGKTQVIDVLQAEVDANKLQMKELTERMQHVRSEKENLESKLEAEHHISRARFRDLTEKQEMDLRAAAEKEQALCRQLELLRASSPASGVTAQRVSELEVLVKAKEDEAIKAEAKFIKTKVWSKSRIRQLEEELRRAQGCPAPPDTSTLHCRVTELEEEKEEMLSKLELCEEMKARNDELQKQLLEYKEQQRKMQADLEQVTKRASSQGSESGSVDDVQMMEWREEAQGPEKSDMVFRMSHIEEEREGLIEDDWLFPGCSDPALANRQQEVEEELIQARGQKNRKPKYFTARSLQDEFRDDVSCETPRDEDDDDDDDVMDGENMGVWWPQHGGSDTDGLRSVVEELELERNRLQEQIVGLERRCEDLEERLQLQARVQSLQGESERLQAQLSALRGQMIRDAEKHQLLVAELNKQIKGLSSSKETLESSLQEKELTLAKSCENLQLIAGLRESLRASEKQHRDAADKLLQAETHLDELQKKCGRVEQENGELKASTEDLKEKRRVLKDETQKLEAVVESLQADLSQTGEELDRLNAAHLEERALLVHELQSCERRIDSLKDAVTEKDKEIAALSSSLVECSEQVRELKQELKNYDVDPRSQSVQGLMKRAAEDEKIIGDLRRDIQHLNTSQKEQLMDKEQMHEKELKILTEERSRLESEILSASRKIQHQERLAQDVQDKQMRICSLEANLKAMREKAEEECTRFNAELETSKESRKKLEDDLTDKSQSLEKLKAEVKSLSDQGCRRQASLETTSAELDRQKLLMCDVRKELQSMGVLKADLLIQIQRLTTDNVRLKDELETAIQALSDVSEAKKDLSSKISALELQLLEGARTTADLQRENEQLTTRGAQLSRELQQNQQATAAILSERSEESNQLRESQEKLLSLTALVETLSQQLDQLQASIVEKERALEEKTTAGEFQDAHVLQLCGALTQLQQQEASLRREIEDRGFRMQDLQLELHLQKQQCSTLQARLDAQAEERLPEKPIPADQSTQTEPDLSQRELLQEVVQEMQEQADALMEKESSACGLLSAESSRLRQVLRANRIILSHNVLSSNALESRKESELLLTSEEQSAIVAKPHAEVVKGLLKTDLLERWKEELKPKARLRSAAPEEFSALQKVMRTFLAQSDASAARLALEMDVISTFQDALQSLMEKNERLSGVVVEKESVLQQQSEKLLHLRGHTTTLESHVSRLKREEERLTTEVTRLREDQTLKNQEMSAYQTQMQKLNELYERLREESGKAVSEKEKVVRQLVSEKEEILRRVNDQITMSPPQEDEKVMGHIRVEDLSAVHQHLQQRDSGLQQLKLLLQQTLEEKEQVSQSLHDTQRTVTALQTRCYWLESLHSRCSAAQDSGCAEVPPGAPQESHILEGSSSISMPSSPRDFSLQLDAVEEAAVKRLDLLHQVKIALLSCQRWVKRKSVYCSSKRLASRLTPRHIFLVYLLSLHLLLLMCLTGSF